jgi:hypothetical protein
MRRHTRTADTIQHHTENRLDISSTENTNRERERETERENQKAASLEMAVNGAFRTLREAFLQMLL